MIQFSLMEKMKTLFETIASSPFFIFLIVFFILLGIVLFDTIKYEQRKIKKIYVMIYLAIFLAIVIKYNTSLFQLLDYLIDNIFVILCYPNFAIYILMILISNILVLRTVFKKDMSKPMKITNIIFYCIKMFMMFLILDNITTNEIDVYSLTSVYTNNKLTMLVELSSAIFFIWILLLTILWIADNVTNHITKDKKVIKVTKNNSKEKNVEKEDIFTEEDYIMMLNLIQLSKEDEYIKEKLKERL